jgi:hypothetical protein
MLNAWWRHWDAFSDFSFTLYSKRGFKKERGTMDNVYILDHLTKNQLKKKGGKMYPLFLDFRAAFDKVDREKMFECMRE